MSIWFMVDPSAKIRLLRIAFPISGKIWMIFAELSKMIRIGVLLKNLDKLSTQTFPIFCSWAVHKRRHQSRGGFAKR